jgi:hypothetical protein
MQRIAGPMQQAVCGLAITAPTLMRLGPAGGHEVQDMRSAFSRSSAVRLLAAGLFVWAAAGISHTVRTAGEAAAADPRQDLVTALQATGPHASLADQARGLGRFVGTWNVAYTDYSKDGKQIQRSGKYIVGWVLDGRALQDVWIVDPSAVHKDREVYTTLHYFDAKSGTWCATFVDPQDASIFRFTGGPVGDDRFVLETHDIDGKEHRWSYDDIRQDSFVWRDEESGDGGKTWRLQSLYHMTRPGAAPSGVSLERRLHL